LVAETKDDVGLPPYPEDLAGELRTAFDEGKQLVVTVISAMGTEQVVSFKEEQG
jgi:translation initiation factor 5A